ncbi:unnamed protein product [Trifolium pratense]|uniref:Uncharacterized protein n=1 Tax=Trifolium pratense TaxID=57577 RepID=A0ACB0IJN1_TRIPR|nr:unnamed protein product [Trifolium pratense]
MPGTRQKEEVEFEEIEVEKEVEEEEEEENKPSDGEDVMRVEVEVEKKKHAELLALPPRGSEVYIGGIPPEVSEKDLKEKEYKDALEAFNEKNREKVQLLTKLMEVSLKFLIVFMNDLSMALVLL